MIISTISRGSLIAGDGSVVPVPGGAHPQLIPRILALARYQIRLTSNSNAVTVVTVKYCSEEWEAWLPDKEDVGVFLGRIVLSLEWVRSVRRSGSLRGVAAWQCCAIHCHVTYVKPHYPQATPPRDPGDHGLRALQSPRQIGCPGVDGCYVHNVGTKKKVSEDKSFGKGCTFVVYSSTIPSGDERRYHNGS